MVSELLVERFQNVTAGQDVAVVVNTDPALITLQISSVQADIEVLRARLRVDQDRTLQNAQQFEQELLIQRVTQATEKANLFLYSNDWVRAQNLARDVKDKTISDAQFDAAKAKYEATVASIQQRDILIQELEKMVQESQPKPAQPGAADPFDMAVEAKANELRQMLKPTTLKAPISGMINMIHHVKGERILRGMPVVSISDPETRRIVGYVRQPVTDIPSTNDFVRIITRSAQRQVARGPILSVGAQFEPINPALLSPDTKRMEVGLPILVGVPPGIRLFPGEHVNLFIEYTKP
jgi:multidrug resistance efflux pump